MLLVGEASAQTMWTNGRWFDGEKFVERTMYSTETGLLSTRRPAKLREKVDLDGRHIVPAYGDAHHHGIDGEIGLDEKIGAFLRDGVFYVRNPNVIPDLLTPAVRGKINRSDSIDVTFSNGGLTSGGSHPGPLHERLADRGVFPGLKREDMPGRGYFIIDDEQALAATWPRILTGRPDFIKVFLNGGARLRGGEVAARTGLSPDVLAAVIRRAHDAGLRVMAHIETADDFALAVRAGVDDLAHLPHLGPRAATTNPAPYLIAPEAAAAAGARGMTAVATASAIPRMHGGGWDDAARAAVADVHRRNLDLLRSHGVKLAIGSDGISGETPFPTAKSEVEYLHKHGLTDGLSLLRMWAVDTPQTIFPRRKIGRLESGFEANFLALEGDPLLDPTNIHRIGLRVKSGKILPAR